MLKLQNTNWDTERGGTVAGKVESSARGALASLSLCLLLSSLGTSAANVALPAMAQTFTASFQEVQWVVLAYLLAITTLIVTAGRLGDLMGRRRLLLTGILLFTAASVVCGSAPWLWLLIAARAVQGLGAAAMMALAMALVGGTVPKAKTGRAMGLLGTMSAVGTALGPSLGGMLMAGFGWRATFLLNVPLGILTFVLAYRFLPMDRGGVKSEQIGFDKAGTLLLALTLGTYSLGVTMGRGHFGLLNVELLMAAAAGAVVFVLVEARAASPLVPLAMFRDPVSSAGLAMSALVSTVMMATLVVGPFYLSRALGLEAALVGIVMSGGPIAAALAGVPAGRLTDRFGTQHMMIAGLGGIAAGALVLSILPATLGIPGYLAPIVVMTAAYALFQTANNSAVMKEILPDQRGVVSGLLNLSRNLGLITGASVMGTVFALASGTTDIMKANPEAIASGMRSTFAASAVLIVIALAIAAGTRALFRRTLDPKVITLVAMAIWGSGSPVQALTPRPPEPDKTRNAEVVGTVGRAAPAAYDPYPLSAAGWGPESGNGLFFSRLAEDWSGRRVAGEAPPLKAMPLGGDAFLTLSAEIRLRYDTFDNGQLTPGHDYQQGLLRIVLRAELRLNPDLRLYGEIGTGQVEGSSSIAPANFQNDASLQQLFIDARRHVGPALIGAMVGRQEFADGPRQLSASATARTCTAHGMASASMLTGHVGVSARLI